MLIQNRWFSLCDFSECGQKKKKKERKKERVKKGRIFLVDILYVDLTTSLRLDVLIETHYDLPLLYPVYARLGLAQLPALPVKANNLARRGKECATQSQIYPSPTLENPYCYAPQTFGPGPNRPAGNIHDCWTSHSRWWTIRSNRSFMPRLSCCMYG